MRYQAGRGQCHWSVRIMLIKKSSPPPGFVLHSPRHSLLDKGQRPPGVMSSTEPGSPPARVRSPISHHDRPHGGCNTTTEHPLRAQHMWCWSLTSLHQSLLRETSTRVAHRTHRAAQSSDSWMPHPLSSCRPRSRSLVQSRTVWQLVVVLLFLLCPTHSKGFCHATNRVPFPESHTSAR